MKINGLKVVDATRPLRIHVSPQDTKGAKKKDPLSCVVARTCTREIKGCTEARVHLGRTYVKIRDQYVRYKTPSSIRSELIAFDRGAGFEAGEYTLTPCPPTAALGCGYGSERGRNKPKHQQKKRVSPHTVHGVRPEAVRGVGQ